jgi:hypothetical protein
MARAEEYDTVEWRCAVDLAELRQRRRPSGVITWLQADTPYASVQWALSDDAVDLVYGYGGQVRQERIRLAQSDTAFDGKRSWFCCPGCSRTVRVLYVGRAGYRCRHCYNLRYPSQREASHHRAIGQAQRLRMKLGGSPDLSQPFPLKPKWMHHATYQRMVDKDRQWTSAWAAGIAKTFGWWA